MDGVALQLGQEHSSISELLTVDAAGAARMLNISQSHLFALKKTGRFGPAPIRLGRSVRYACEELRDWVRAGCPSRARWLAMRDG